MDAASEHVLLSIGICNLLKDEQNLEAYLTRNASIAITLRDLNCVMTLNDLNYKQAQSIFNMLSEIKLSDGFAKAMQGERVFFMYKIKGENNVSGYPFLNFDRALFVKYSLKLNSLSKMNYKEAAASGLFDQSKKIPRYTILMRILFPVDERASTTFYKASAQIACAQTGLALCAYKDRFGSYPQSLKELQTKLGWKLTKDPFSGQGLIYKRKGNGYIVYSVGQDLADNNGADLKFGRDNKQYGDIAWKINH